MGRRTLGVAETGRGTFEKVWDGSWDSRGGRDGSGDF